MNVCTISVNINTPDYNYGALLHSWAFQQFLLKQDGIDTVDIIDYVTPYLEHFLFAFPFRYYLEAHGKRAAASFLLNFHSYFIKYIKFRLFIRKHIKKTEKQYTQKSLNEADLSFYDAVVCESDVIWSPLLTKGTFDKSFFAALDSMKGLRRIAYSPSLGDVSFSEKDYTEFERLIQGIDFISCRETYAKPIIERYAHKHVEHVLDPVLLLSADDYEGIVGKQISGLPYLLLYLPVNDNNKLRKAAKEYATKHSLQIIEITNKLRKVDPNIRTLITAGIEEFLSAIKYSNIVFTNSFHAICFSIIFEKQFYAFSRKYPGKVRNICEVMGLENRYFADDRFTEQNPIDFSKVRIEWEKKRKQSAKWLLESLTVEQRLNDSNRV